MAKDKICFVIAPIGEPDSETRKRSDQILKHVITPAIESFDYKPVRADQISEPGIITSQVIQHIVDDPLVIADLTDKNPNVFYELALRHALKRPFIQLIKKGEQIPFDVAGTRTVQVDHKDLDSVEQAKKEIAAQVYSLETDPSKLETPISVSIDLKNLRESGDPERRSMGEILEILNGLKAVLIRQTNEHQKLQDVIAHQFDYRLREREVELKALLDKAVMNRKEAGSMLENLTEAREMVGKFREEHPELKSEFAAPLLLVDDVLGRLKGLKF